MLGYLFVDCGVVILDCTVFKVFVLFCLLFTQCAPTKGGYKTCNYQLIMMAALCIKCMWHLQ